jgi:hypothetical protein
MTKKIPRKTTPPLSPNQAYLDANKKSLKAVEAALAAKKQAAVQRPKWWSK